MDGHQHLARSCLQSEAGREYESTGTLRRSLSQNYIDSRQLSKASVSATKPRGGMLAQWQRTALIAAAALDSPVLRRQVSEKLPLELKGDLFVLASWVLVRYAQNVQLAVAAVVLHKEWASAAGKYHNFAIYIIVHLTVVAVISEQLSHVSLKTVCLFCRYTETASCGSSGRGGAGKIIVLLHSLQQSSKCHVKCKVHAMKHVVATPVGGSSGSWHQLETGSFECRTKTKDCNSAGTINSNAAEPCCNAGESAGAVLPCLPHMDSMDDGLACNQGHPTSQVESHLMGNKHQASKV